MDVPAWSEAFAAGRLGPVEPLPLPQRITPEWAFGDGSGRGVRVAVIDSGVDARHPAVGAVAGGVVLEHDPEAPDGARVVEGPHQDLFGHGTACAGIIRALAPESEIYSVRVLGARLTGKGVVFAAGIRWAARHGMHVANLSLSSARQDLYGLFHSVADEASFAGLSLVCAANNSPGPSFPSLFSSVLSVACLPAGESGFAYNPSPPVEFGAPGIDVDVAWLDGARITSTGNSYAAPHITGLVARVLGAHPGLRPFQVKTVLQAIADNARAS